MALLTTVTARVAAAHTSALDLATASVGLDFLKRISLSSGTGANQADRMFHDRRTVSASGSENLDLAGSLTDSFGATFTLARVKLLAVYAATTNTNNVNVTATASNGVPGLFLALGDGIVVRPGGVFLWTAPDATAAVVTASTGDLLTVANSSSGTSVTYDVVIIGASA
jgi:hypothetical protein